MHCLGGKMNLEVDDDHDKAVQPRCRLWDGADLKWVNPIIEDNEVKFSLCSWIRAILGLNVRASVGAAFGLCWQLG
jgi:hypothetical protein